MIFRKKITQDNPTLETKSVHKLTGLVGISSIFRNHSNENSFDTPVDIADIEKSILLPKSDLPKASTSKTVRLIQEVQKLEDRTIKPFVDYNEGRLFYPLLSKIGEVQDNIEYLDGLVTDGILEQKIYEK